jgi:hypothetical protein
VISAVSVAKGPGWTGVAGIILLLWCISISAAPVTNNILDYYEVEQSKEKLTIEIFFTLPVFYMNHFPAAAGDTLTIMVHPIALAGIDRNSFGHREALAVRQSDEVPLTDIEFEGESGFGSYLVVYFSKPVNYRVSPGERFESIRIELTN